ncbi:MAG: hypothetical protein HY862_06775 [Chloroflexi bacterium]|nr:hypothetical protein [Chloroflexota bacterium]
MGDMPDFENMTLEEQMRWLESLAARQGANPQEFMTTADMSVPEIDPNSVVIDEPGYVPSEKFSRPLSAAAGPSRPVEAPPQATEPIVPPVEAPAYDYTYAEQPTVMDYQFQEPPPIEPVTASAADPNDPLGGMDPMAWLESLAARQGANPNEFMTAANYEIAEIDPNSVVIDEPGYVPSEKFSRPLSAAAGPSRPVEAPPQATEPIVPIEVPAPEPIFETPPAAAWIPQDGEIPVEVDPMAWLESLAARQGADPTEFMTAANYEIPEIDPTSVIIDEPGYVPYSPFETTSGQSTSFATTESNQPPVPAMPLPEFAAEPSEDTSSLSWLSDLAGDPNAGVPDFLSSLATDDIPSFDLGYETAPEQPASATPHIITSIEGLTDEQIAEAQAHGTITPEAELAWLMKKAESLAALTPLNEEFEATLAVEGSDIAPGQIPDWLAAQMPTDLGSAPVTEDSFPALIDEILPPPAPTDLPDWLSESPMVQGSPEIELPEFTLEDTTGFTPMQDDVLAASDFVAGYAQSGDDWATALDEEYAMQHQTLPSDAEPEWYAEAVSKIEETPLESVQSEAFPEFDASMFAMPIETEFISAEPTDLPDWLQEMSGQVAPADSDLPEWLISSPIVEPEAISEVATPDWLSEPVYDPLSFVAENAPSEADTFDYSQFTSEAPAYQSETTSLAEAEERLSAAQEGGLPSWYQAPVVETPPVYVAPPQPVVQRPPAPPPPAVTPVPPMAAPAPQPTAPAFTPAASSRQVAQPVPPPSSPAPVPAGFAHYQAALEQNPHDHNTRLNLARELDKVGNLHSSLEHYETLVESSAALEVVADDLSKLSTRQPQHPRVRRLLGDTYMRQGRLQEALDAYRGALNQL